jgi:hypothetical protein
MGTSGAYGGSAGRAWGKVRQQASDYADNPSDANADKLLGGIADAVDWDGDAANAPPQPGEAPQPLRPNFGQAPILGAGGRGSRGGGASGAGGGGSGGGRSGTGRSRSRARAARVGGTAAAVGLAYRNRDAGTLARFNLTLAELDALDSFEQTKRILAAVGASLGDVPEEELMRASGSALLALLQDESPTGADGVRAFVTEYVWEVSLTEIGDAFRNGDRDGFASLDDEEQLRAVIETRVSQVELPEHLGTNDIQAAVYTALDDARTFIKAKT